MEMRSCHWLCCLREARKANKGIGFTMRRLKGARAGPIGAVLNREGHLLMGNDARLEIAEQVQGWFGKPECEAAVAEATAYWHNPGMIGLDLLSNPWRLRSWQKP